MSPIEALQPAIILLGAGTASALASRAFRLSPMVGYIIAGVIIGPYGLNALRENDTTHLLAELGVVFLLFDIGLHFSLREMRESKRDMIGLAPLQMLLCGSAFTILAVVSGLSWPIGIAIGVSLALSSTAVVTRVLAERELNTSPLGRSSVAILVFQDVVAIFLLIFANSLADDPATLLSTMGLAALQAVLAFGAAAFVGLFIVRPLFQVLASADVKEVFTMVAILIVVASAAVTESIGLSLTLGAFLAGMAIADTPFRHAIQTEVMPFRDLLIGFFFVNVGLMIDLASLWKNLPLIIALTLAIMLIKTVLIFMSARISRWSVPGATQLAFTLSQASEFTLVVLSITAIRAGTPGEGISILVAATALSLGLAPVWTGVGLRLARIIAARLMKQKDTGQAQPEKSLIEKTAGSEPVVIVFGMTQTGRIAIDGLIAMRIPHIALDSHSKRFVQAIADGYEVVFGDTSDFRMIDSLKAGKAKVLLLGEPRFAVSQALTGPVHHSFPDLVRFVAVGDAEEKANHLELGMRPRVVKTPMDAIALAGDVLTELEVPKDKVRHWMDTEIERYERDRKPEKTPEVTKTEEEEENA